MKYRLAYNLEFLPVKQLFSKKGVAAPMLILPKGVEDKMKKSK